MTPALLALLAAFERAYSDPAAKALLNPKWREINARPGCPPSRGFCYIAAEALFHRLGGAAAGYRAKRAAYVEAGEDVDHWWLEGPDGAVVDPSVSQFALRGVPPPYHLGKGRGFMTRDPSKRARALSAIVDRLLSAPAGPDYPPRPVVEAVGRFRVAREDLVPGGTKERALRVWLPTVRADSFVYATPAQGYAQVAAARVCRALGKPLTLFVAQRDELHPRTAAAVACGAWVEPVPMGFLRNVQAKAAAFAESAGAYLLPFGLGCPEFEAALVDVLLSSGEDPAEVWTVAGSGTLSRCVQRAWPRAWVRAVCVGCKSLDTGRAKQFWYDRDFAQPARLTPPFPSVIEYDAKGWEVMQEHGNDGALFWNVAGDDHGPRPRRAAAGPEIGDDDLPPAARLAR